METLSLISGTVEKERHIIRKHSKRSINFLSVSHIVVTHSPLSALDIADGVEMNIRFIQHPKILFHASTTVFSKTLFHWVNLMFNRVSEDRIKEVGPDLACAEWLLRNGAQVQWKGSNTFTEDYNKLPYDESGKSRGSPLYLYGIDASNATIMANGFPHFNGCQYIENIKLKECNLLSNNALPHLQLLENSLKHLEINTCRNISDEGILSLTILRNLETLKLVNLSAVKNKKSVEEQLREALPKTHLSFYEKNE